MERKLWNYPQAGIAGKTLNASLAGEGSSNRNNFSD